MRILLPALLLATSLAALPTAADDGAIGLKPEQIGQIFCLSRLGSDEGPIMGILSPELTAAIGDAWTANDAWIAANPPFRAGASSDSWNAYSLSLRVVVWMQQLALRRNRLAPGFVDTAMTRRIPDPVRARINDRSVLGRFGTAQEIAAAAVFLCDDATFCTGSVLTADGGWSL